MREGGVGEVGRSRGTENEDNKCKERESPLGSTGCLLRDTFCVS